jgi:hypothetical protein
MSLPTGFRRAGMDLGEVPGDSTLLLSIVMSPEGQIIVVIKDFLGEMCNAGNEQALRLLSSLPAVLKDAV